jgi:hypothetical protein
MPGLPRRRAAEPGEPLRANGGGLSLGAAALALLAAMPLARASSQQLFWLAPDRVAHGRALIGLTSVEEGEARLPQGARVRAEGASLEELAPEGEVRVFAVSPTDSAVRLRAEEGPASVQARIEVGPPSAAVAIRAAPASPVKGRDREVALEIAVLRGDGQPDPDASMPVLRANVGEVVELGPRGGGRFEARYRLPEKRHPEVAIVVAFAPWPHADSDEGALGAAVIPLSSTALLPGQTEPGASIAVDIAGQVFGPVRSDAQGHFELAVVVPPGHRYGVSRATDRAGNCRTKPLDLQLPPTDQIACVANPSGLPADGRSRAKVLCVATDPFGVPAVHPAIHARARAGKLTGPVPAAAGCLAWEYTAPELSDGRPEELVFEYPAGGPQSVERLALKLRSLAAASAELRVAPQPVFAGGSAAAVLMVRDHRGRPAAARPSFRAERGALSELALAPDGSYRGTYRAPIEAGDWADRILGEVLSAAGAVPARLELSAAGGTLAARAAGLDGAPVEGLALALGSALGRTSADGIAHFPVPPAPWRAPIPLEVRAIDRPSLRALSWLLPIRRGAQLFPGGKPPAPLELQVPVALAPAAPVDVRIEFEDGAAAGVRVRALDPRGAALGGREIAVELLRPGGVPVAHGPAQPQADGSVFFNVAERVGGAVTAVAVDVASGVSAARQASLP